MLDEEQQALINTLEDLLVREFRTCQLFLTLTHDERQALTRQELSLLSTLIDEKEVLLDELAQTEDQRRAVVQKLVQKKGCQRLSGRLAALEPALPTGAGERLNRLREGILALSSKIQTLVNGNQRLAIMAMSKVEPQGRELYDQRAVYQSTFEVGQRAISALNLFDMLS